MANKKQKELLKNIKVGTNSEAGHLMVERSEDLQALVADGVVQINENLTDGNQVAARSVENTEIKPNGSALPQFTLMQGIPLSPAQRGGRREELYPFSQMQIGDSFLVPVTTATPKPWETFASTVSSATRRFSAKSETETRKNRKGTLVPVLKPTRKFTLRRVTAGDKYENGFVEPASGARVFRTA